MHITLSIWHRSQISDLIDQFIFYFLYSNPIFCPIGMMELGKTIAGEEVFTDEFGVL